MSKRDCYETLGVSKGASDSELGAYRRLAMKCHPDRNPAMLRQKPNSRSYRKPTRFYRMLKSGPLTTVMAMTLLRVVWVARRWIPQQWRKLLGYIRRCIRRHFWRRSPGEGGRSSVQRGSDLRYTLDLTLEEAVFGVEKTIRVPRLAECATCKGSGAKPGSAPKTCQTCNGQVAVRMQQGFFAIQQTCPRCHGQGKVITDPCSDCRGQGRKEETKTLSVKIPAGVDTGDRVRLSGEGEAGVSGGPAGDLYVQVNASSVPDFYPGRQRLVL